MDLTYSEFVEKLARSNGIGDGDLKAFRSRLNKLQSVGVPQGSKTGRGRRVVYTVPMTIEAALAVELAQFGLSSERSATVMMYNRWPMIKAMGAAADALASHRDQYFPPRRPGERDARSVFIYFDPSALEPIGTDLSPDQPGDDTAAWTFFFGGTEMLLKQLEHSTYGESSRLAIINLTSLIDRLVLVPDVDIETQASADGRRRIFKEISDWARDEARRLPNLDRSLRSYAMRLTLWHHKIFDPRDLAIAMSISNTEAERLWNAIREPGEAASLMGI